MRRNTTLGIIGVVGIWLTAGFALPFVNWLGDFSPTQLMAVRGVLTCYIAFTVLFISRWGETPADRYAYLIMLVLPLATLGLFQGIRHWGVGPTIVIITATPVVNFFLNPMLGRKTTLLSVLGFALILGGVVVARWGGIYHLSGFLWSAFGALANGVLYELFAKTKTGSFTKCAMGGFGMGILGLVMSKNDSWTPLQDPQIIWPLLAFALIGGFFYWLANMLAFENLPTDMASALAQLETPAVILGAYFILGEAMSLTQWAGVVITIGGGALLLHSLKEEEQKPKLRLMKE